MTDAIAEGSRTIRLIAIDDESCDVEVLILPIAGETHGERLLFHFNTMHLKGTKLDTMTQVEYFPDGMRPQLTTFGGHLDALSISNRQAFRRNLEDFFDQSKTDWDKAVASACSMAYHYLIEGLRSETVEEPISTRVQYLISPLLPKGGVTMFYGPGGTGKGVFTLAMVICLCSGVDFMGFQTSRDIKDRAIHYLDYEDDKETFNTRVKLICNGLGLSLPKNLQRIFGGGVPLADQAGSIRSILKREDSALMVVDSAVPALGGNPSDPEPVSALFRAIRRLEMPVWMIAHENRAGDDAHPYGSIFWENLPRLTINVRSEPAKANAVNLILQNKKNNNDKKFQPLGFEMAWLIEEHADSIRVNYLSKVPDNLTVRLPLKDRLIARLRAHPWLTKAELAVDMDEKQDKVYRQLIGSPDTFLSRERPAPGRGRPSQEWALIVIDNGSGPGGNGNGALLNFDQFRGGI